MSKNIINVLEAECNKLIESNICLEKITKKILSPSNKSIRTKIFIILTLILFALYLVSIVFYPLTLYSSLLTMFWGAAITISIYSLIILSILWIPIRKMLKSRRNKRFDKYKDELKPILFDIKKTLIVISKNQIKFEFINEPCLREISRYIEKDGNTVDEAVKRFETEKYNSKEFVHKKKIAEIRCKNLLALDKLSKTPHVTSSLQKWTDLYSNIWEAMKDYR